MNLPKIDLPIYDFELPSTGKTIQFRPFRVKEQKILLMAMESKNEIDAINAVKQIVSNCVVSEDFNVDEMSSFDIEYFFVKLRMNSIGEKVNLTFSCKNEIEPNKICNHVMEFQHDLTTVTIERNPQHERTIFFTKDVGVVMKYPGFKNTEKMLSGKDKSSVETALDMIVNCIDYFFDKDNNYYIKEMNRKEVMDYIENIPKASFDKMEKFFDTFPKVKSVVEHKCEKCGFEHSIPVEGLTSFFA